jgi:serine/threonine-protein kinase RsbW
MLVRAAHSIAVKSRQEIITVIRKSTLQTRTDLLELTRVLSWLNQVTQRFLPRSTLIQCQTLLAEGFTNAVRHAHEDRSVETPIDIELTLSECELEMRIWDYGIPFGLMKKLESLPETIDTGALGGRGLKLFEQIADHFSYTRTENNRNCLLLVKRYSLTDGAADLKYEIF